MLARGGKMKLVAIALSAAAVVAVTATSSSAVPVIEPPTKYCAPPFAGPKVSVPWKGGKKSRNHYVASVWTYSCSTAIGYVKKFYARRSAGENTTLPGGPAGYVCKSLTPKGYTLFQGSCKKGRGSNLRGFTWGLEGLTVFAWGGRKA
jgi:hypothetical protein